MLALTRKLLEKIELELEDGRLITIWPTRIGGGRVTIAVEAPKSIDIRREELKPEAAE